MGPGHRCLVFVLKARLVIGLTGGIGAGKSTVGAQFASLGVSVIDADSVARELVEPGQPALSEVVQSFGVGVQDAGGRLDRAKLREVVFAEPGKRRALERILHPRIRREMDRRLHESHGPYCILSIPLLLETGQADRVDRVLVVDVPEEVQLARVMRRDGSSRRVVEGILCAQLARADRLARADDVIDNSAGLESLTGQVHEIHQRYLRLAQSLPVADK